MVIAAVDIAGFAKVCLGKTDLETFDMLDRFYKFVGKVVDAASGTAVKFMGDCAFVVFPANNAKQAVAVLRRLKSCGIDIGASSVSACSLRVHAHIGRVVSGPIGPDKKFDVVGKNVNYLFMMPWDGPELSGDLKKVIEKE